MTDSEKVVNGLECCNPNEYHCGVCPYDDGYESCARCKPALHSDAIYLLKAQEHEPIVPIRRSAHAQGADDVWYECGKCGEFLGVNPYSKQFCANCGRAVKWNG